MLYGIAVFGAGRGTAVYGHERFDTCFLRRTWVKRGRHAQGVHFLNREFTPNVLTYKGDKYHTMGLLPEYHAVQVDGDCVYLYAFEIDEDC